MGTPQRNRIRIFSGGGDLVCDRGGGPWRQAGIATEPSQTLDAARHAQHQHRRERGRRQQEEDAEADGAAGRRQPKPKAKPRHREEEADDGRDRRQRRPQPFPENRPERSREGAGERVLAEGLVNRPRVGTRSVNWRIDQIYPQPTRRVPRRFKKSLPLSTGILALVLSNYGRDGDYDVFRHE